LHTCALVGGIGILVAAVISLVLIGVRPRAARTAEAAAAVGGAAAAPGLGALR
jgi:hypothetical protein